MRAYKSSVYIRILKKEHSFRVKLFVVSARSVGTFDLSVKYCPGLSLRPVVLFVCVYNCELSSQGYPFVF
jgi:hypothetical protein